jgi:6,7-dimethyl-8-ribityllumazine synthase
MPQVYEGALDARGLRVALVVARFNDLFTNKLLAGAVDCLQRHGADPNDIDVVRVPGSFEVPLAAQAAAASGRYDAVVCLAAVIRGATPHFEHVAAQVASGVARVGLDTGVPVLFGVLTTDSLEQAVERAGTKSGNKGWDAALAAIEMANVLRALRGAGAGATGGTERAAARRPGGGTGTRQRAAARARRRT